MHRTATLLLSLSMLLISCGPEPDLLFGAQSQILGDKSPWSKAKAAGYQKEQGRSEPTIPSINTTERLWAGVNNGDIFDEDDATIDTMLDQLARSNLRVIRVLIDYRLEMGPWGWALPRGRYDDCILRRIDKLMVKAQKKGILLLITLHSHNWIHAANPKVYTIKVSPNSASWRQCQTPVLLYAWTQYTGQTFNIVGGPYRKRGYADGSDLTRHYFTGAQARADYKARVSHILNHYNPYLKRKWKDLNDVVWGWGLHNEPEHVMDGKVTRAHVSAWFREMAAYVKSVDPDTYVVLGNMNLDPGKFPGLVPHADVYTIHDYARSNVAALAKKIDDFYRITGRPHGKLLLVEEFNAFNENNVAFQRAPNHRSFTEANELRMDLSRRHGVAWMLWEHGYNYDVDDLWHKNSSTQPDGIVWGAKIAPGARDIWSTSWDARAVGQRWKVQRMVRNLCTRPGAACAQEGPIHFSDTYGGDKLVSEWPGISYDRRDRGTTDSYAVSRGLLSISAARRQDLWGGSGGKDGAPLALVQAPLGDYWAETLVTADPNNLHRVPVNGAVVSQQPLNTQMGLFVFGGVNAGLFFGLTRHDFTSAGTRIRGNGLAITVTDSQGSRLVKTIKMEQADLAFLRVVRQGNKWHFSYRLEQGEQWKPAGTVTLALGVHQLGPGIKTLDIGFGQGQANPGTAYFDFLAVGRQ